MIRYFYGPDTYAARAAIGQRAQDEQARLTWLDKDDLTARPLAETLGQTRGLFGTHLCVIRDASNLPASLQETLLATLEQTTTDVILWDRQPPNRRSAVYKSFKKDSQEFPLPAATEAATWLQAEATKYGGEITPDAATLLVARVGRDRWRLRGELEKLLLTASPVTTAHVTAAVPPPPEAEIFATLAALLQKNKAATLASIQTLLAAGHSELYILSMLAWQFRSLVAVKTGVEQKSSVHEIVRTFGLKLYTVQKTLPQVANISRAALLDNLTVILATDFAIKQGKVPARTGLLMLVVRLLAGR